MLEIGDRAPEFSLTKIDGGAWPRIGAFNDKASLVVFFETDCPTCQIALPYLNHLSQVLGPESERILAVSQDGESATRRLAQRLDFRFPVALDRELRISRLYDPQAVPGLFLIGVDGHILDKEIGLDKARLNRIAARLLELLGKDSVEIAPRFDGNPERKPGCTSRHRERQPESPQEPHDDISAELLQQPTGAPASRILLDDPVDPYEYCMEKFGDPLPVVPPTVERVERMLAAAGHPPHQIIGRIPPNYGEATVEKIAANAVMAGCPPELMRVLIPLVMAACDERFNLHGVQATTHFAAPLLIVNGPVRHDLGFASGSNVFSNVSRANSSLGRALQLMLVNLGGARPGEIDMSTLGNPGKFSYCIAENEEESPWDPLHVEVGFRREESTVTLFAAEAPHGVSEHKARTGIAILKAICWTLATVRNYRVCNDSEAVVVFCPEHVRTLSREAWKKEDVRRFLFEHTGVPVRAFGDESGEGCQFVDAYSRIWIDGEECYQKFRDPSAIKIVVAGGTAGKFSAVIGSWATGSRGSQMVTYPISKIATPANEGLA